MFELGEKVICVDDDPESFAVPDDDSNDWPLEQGVIYTISGFDKDPIYNVHTLYLVEIPDRSNGEFADYGFAQARFRKLIKKKQSIEVFEKILNKVNNKELV